MYYCSAGHLLASRTAHCTYVGCGWENPLYVAEEVAAATGNLELAEDLALARGDVGAAIAYEVQEEIQDAFGW